MVAQVLLASLKKSRFSFCNMSSEDKAKTNVDDAGDSDVELEGIDLESEAGNDGQGDVDMEDATNDLTGAEIPVENEEEIDALALEEAKEMEEARKEQMELMAAEQQKAMAGKPVPATPQERLEYILAQSDVFAHFLAGL